MPRPERPIIGDSPLAQFARNLRELRQLAGSPSVRSMTQYSGYSVGAFSMAASGRFMPSWKLVSAYLLSCARSRGNDIVSSVELEDWRLRWESLSSVEPPESEIVLTGHAHENYVTYRILGPLEVGGRPIKLPGGLTRNLVAILLLNANRPVSKADLIRASWGYYDSSDAQLHKRISEVRRLLAQIGRSKELVTVGQYGYELRTAEDDVDALLFHRLSLEANIAASEQDFDREVDRLRRALRLWRGVRPLSDIPTVPRQDIDALESRRRRVAIRLFDVEMVRGNYERILDDLMLMTEYYPSDRRLCGQMMVAGYFCGNVTHVLAVFERHVRALDEESATRPDPALRDLYYSMARGERIDGYRGRSIMSLIGGYE